MSGKTFRQAVREAAAEADLTLGQRIKLRVIMRVAPAKLEQELFNQAQAEGVVPVAATLDSEVGERDWSAWLEFLKVALPILLEIFKLIA